MLEGEVRRSLAPSLYAVLLCGPFGADLFYFSISSKNKTWRPLRLFFF